MLNIQAHKLQLGDTPLSLSVRGLAVSLFRQLVRLPSEAIEGNVAKGIIAANDVINGYGR